MIAGLPNDFAVILVEGMPQRMYVPKPGYFVRYAWLISSPGGGTNGDRRSCPGRWALGYQADPH